MVILTPGRAEFLNLDEEKMNKRMAKLEPLDEALTKLSMILAEGHGLGRGLQFKTGAHLAELLHDTMRFSIAYLQEDGKLAKTLPGTKKKKEEDKGHGTYL